MFKQGLSGSIFTINFTSEELIRITEYMKSMNVDLETAIKAMSIRGLEELKASIETYH